MYRADQNQLPFPIDRWDQSTINPGLPQQNDVWPNIAQPPGMNGNVISEIIAGFRFHAQSRINKSPLHVLVYNVLSANYFNNADFVNWCQTAVDFTEYLMVCQGDVPQVAVDKAIKLIYKSALAIIAGTYPIILNYVDENTRMALKRAGDDYRDIVRDIQTYQTRGNMGWGTQQIPGYQHAGLNQQMNPRAIQQPAVSHPVRSYPVNNVLSGSTPTKSGGRYVEMDINQQNEFTAQSWTAGKGTVDTVTHNPNDSNVGHSGTVGYSDVPDGFDVPKTIDEVKVDPDYYRPAGFNVSVKRPYDVIHNPGGIVIKPAHQSGWKRTKNDFRPYMLGYDPARFVMFHVMWPDGVVEEKLVEWEPTMEYLKHELFKQPPKLDKDGKVVPVDDVESSTIQKEIEVYPERVIATTELDPVYIDDVLVASTDQENEKTARITVMEQLELVDPKDVPAHVYHSVKVYPIDINAGIFPSIGKAKELVIATESCKTLLSLRDMLTELRLKSVLDDRTFNFINCRLTTAVNYMLAYNLSMPECNIDSFDDDIEDLINVLQGIDGDYVQVIHSHTPAFIRRWLKFVDAEDEGGSSFSIIDEVINLQVNWSSNQLARVSKKKGEPFLISATTLPDLLKALNLLIKNRSEAGRLVGCSLRMISKDGMQYDIIRGWLVKDALLLKQSM